MVQHVHNQYHNTSHRATVTAHLTHAMTLLALNSTELQQKIINELAKNPALELIEGNHCPSCGHKLPPHTKCPQCSIPSGFDEDEAIVFVSTPDSYQNSGSSYQNDQDYETLFSAEHVDLPTYVLSQIAVELEAEDREIAVYILANLDEDGYFCVPQVEIAQFLHVSLGRVRDVLDLIQQADPIGVGAVSGTDALLIQLESLSPSENFACLVRQTIEEEMTTLGRKQYAQLGKNLGITAKKAVEIADFIVDNLNPYPARAQWGTVREKTSSPSVYKNPDIIIREQNNRQDPRLIIEILWPLRGQLRINPLFKNAMKDAPADKIEEWKALMEKGDLLIKCLRQRNHTLVRLMQKLSAIQREFILEGDASITPLTRASLADDLDVHESTISRAVTGKSVQLPTGQIIPISKFFDRSLHIRTALKKIVEEETKPLSDTKIAERLADEGYAIARRTVAKYRNMEKILPARLRTKPRELA